MPHLSPIINHTSFMLWADEHWQQVPTPEFAEWEQARWKASIDGKECVVILYGRKKGMGRINVQGLPSDDCHRLTKQVLCDFIKES